MRADERRIWYRLLTSDDDRFVLDAMKFLVPMRDGRPAQQINVTQVGVAITPDEIAKARQIVREVLGPSRAVVTGAGAGPPRLVGNPVHDGTQ